jgi:hypothetical protein
MPPFFLDVWMEAAVQRNEYQLARLTKELPDFAPANENTVQAKTAQQDSLLG